MVLPSEPRKVSAGVDAERMGETIGVLERLLVVVLVPSGRGLGAGAAFPLRNDPGGSQVESADAGDRPRDP
jgi:hypothetical protein